MPRLKTTYEKEIVGKLLSKLSLKNRHDVPKVQKIILNMGLGEDASDSKKLKACVDDMALIAGQKPIITLFGKNRAKKFSSPYCEQKCINTEDFGKKNVVDLEFKPVYDEFIKMMTSIKK